MLSLFIAGRARAEMGAGAGLSPWDTGSKKKEKQAKTADTFIRVLTDRFQLKLEDMEKLWAKGYGRNELIKLILISAHTNKELKEVQRKRERGVKFSRIAEEYKLDYPALLEEAKAVRREIDYKISTSTPAANEIYKIRLTTPSAPENDHH